MGALSRAAEAPARCVQDNVLPRRSLEQPLSVTRTARLQPGLSPGDETPSRVTAQPCPVRVCVLVLSPVHMRDLLWAADDTEPSLSRGSRCSWGSTSHIPRERRGTHTIHLAVHTVSEGAGAAGGAQHALGSVCVAAASAGCASGGDAPVLSGFMFWRCTSPSHSGTRASL